MKKIANKIIHGLDILYYYYYTFYMKIYKDSDPTFTAKLSITASESFFIIALYNISWAYFFCRKVGKVEMIGVIVIVLLLNNIILLKSERIESILKKKPKFLNSEGRSILLTWIFFLSTTSVVFWLGNVLENIIDNCR